MKKSGVFDLRRSWFEIHPLSTLHRSRENNLMSLRVRLNFIYFKSRLLPDNEEQHL